MCLHWVLIFVLIFINYPYAYSQIITKNDTIVSPSNVIFLKNNLVPGTVFSVPTPDSIDYFKGILYFSKPTDTIFVKYQYFPNLIQNNLGYIPQNKISSDTSLKNNPYLQNWYYQDTFLVEKLPYDPFAQSRLEKSGVLARGITVGTNRDLSVNSTFRLQLKGDLGDDISIVAGITDENIPIQPSGSTEQLSDFDKVFIQLKHKNKYLTLGDIEIQKKDSRFANFYRNTLGLQGDLQGNKLKSTVFFSAAKGKFHSMSFQGEEAKQGPYRLTGKNNERFVIVLAGSEKVYVNGKRLNRGKEYVIEYNTGELTFTSQFPINSSHRIVVDYEYADRNYGRSLTGFFMDYQLNNKWKLKLSQVREADNPNVTTDFILTDKERKALQNAGDNPDSAFVLGGDSVGWIPGKILYAKHDTSIFGIFFPEVYYYSTDSNSAHYQVVFAYVGENKGLYQQEKSLINGNIYSFVGINENQTPLGSYMPIKVIPIPKSLTVSDLIAEYEVNSKLKIISETAISNFDKNRLSNKNDNDNRDIAAHLTFLLKDIRIGSYILQNQLITRYTGNRFQNIDRINPIEYGREWNFNENEKPQVEKVVENILSLTHQKFSVKYNAGSRFVNQYFGIKNQLNIQSDSLWLSGNYLFYHAYSKEPNGFSSWIRHNGNIYKKMNQFRLGTEIWLENKKIVRDTSQTKISKGSFAFDDFKPYFSINLEKFQSEVYFNYRKEKEYANTSLLNKNLSNTYGAKFQWNPSPLWSLNNSFQYRNFKVLDSLFYEQNLQNQVTITNNFQTSFNTSKRYVQTQLFYEILTEKIARKQMIFVEVNPGLGEYEWIDANQNGVQELNEFQVSTNPITANFMRYFVPTLNLYPVISKHLQFQFRVDFNQFFDKKATGFKSFLRQINLFTNLKKEQKHAPEIDNIREYFFKNYSSTDTNLVSSLYLFKQDLVFWRNNKKGDLLFSYQTNNNRQFLNSGSDYSKNEQWISKQRWNFYKKLSLENTLQTSTKILKSQFFEDRNFEITSWNVQPMLVIPFKASFRSSFGFDYKFKNQEHLLNSQYNAQTKIIKLITDHKINIYGKNTLNGKIEFWNISLVGSPTPSARFELLESLQPGNNLTMNIFLSWFLSKTLELNVVYDGRWNKFTSPIHSGRVQLRAIL